MSSYAYQHNPQTDWWTQPVDNYIRNSGDQRYGSVSAVTCEYPVQQQSQGGDCRIWAPAQVNDAPQPTQVMPNYWLGHSPAFVETSMAFAPLLPQPMYEPFPSQTLPSASLPPAAFTKQPLAIDHFSTNTFQTFDNASSSAFYNNQVLSATDVPALEYDSASADETARSRINWTDSPTVDEVDHLTVSGEVEDNLENSDPCYAELLRQALMEKKDDHTLLLKDLYEWVRTHSSKAQDPNNRGWQNSVRHNLSMNAAFERVPPPNQEAGTKKTSYWRLTQDAVERGISSTTRYRKDSKRKTQRNPNPAPIRVQAGAKGGQATRRSVRRQQMASSPLDNLSSSNMSRQRNSRRPHHPHRFPDSYPDVSPLQQQNFPTSGNSPYFENATEIFDPLPNPYSGEGRVGENNDFLAPFSVPQSSLDWSVSPSPMSHVGNEGSGWRVDQKTFGV